MNLKPLGDRVIVKQDEAEETTASGLYLATEAKEKPQSGTVLAVGDGKLDKDGNLVPVPVKVGDKVVYGKFGGTEINVEGEDVLINIEVGGETQTIGLNFDWLSDAKLMLTDELIAEMLRQKKEAGVEIDNLDESIFDEVQTEDGDGDDAAMKE